MKFSLVASNPNHPLNAKLMHSYLKDFTMKDRDVWFIVLLNDIYLDYGINPIKDWLIGLGQLKIESIYLMNQFFNFSCIILVIDHFKQKAKRLCDEGSYFYFTRKNSCSNKTLKEFEDIHEPYIYERLFAIAFGVVVRVEKIIT